MAPLGASPMPPKACAWRPVRFYRTAARKFMLRLDNQLRTSTALRGHRWACQGQTGGVGGRTPVLMDTPVA